MDLLSAEASLLCLNLGSNTHGDGCLRSLLSLDMNFPHACPDPKNHLLGATSAPQATLRLGKNFPFRVTLVDFV